MKLSEIIDVFIAGDWGNESPSLEAPHAVSCVRGADIVPISNNEFANIPLRYVSEHSFQQKLLQVGDIVIEKSGGSPPNQQDVPCISLKPCSPHQRMLFVLISALLLE